MESLILELTHFRSCHLRIGLLPHKDGPVYFRIVVKKGGNDENKSGCDSNENFSGGR